MPDNNPDLDMPRWGAEAIGRDAGLVNDDGTVNLRAVYYALEQGHLPATKVGKRWVSTRRRIYSVFAGETA
jgi:hypothetical protein